MYVNLATTAHTESQNWIAGHAAAIIGHVQTRRTVIPDPLMNCLESISIYLNPPQGRCPHVKENPIKHRHGNKLKENRGRRPSVLWTKYSLM